MKPFTRKATVIWLGTHPHGKGAMTTPSAVLKRTPYGSGTRTTRAKGTNPPELIAAAHAGSFSITLADELGAAGYHPNQIDTTATVTMKDIAAKWTMTHIHLDVIATVPNAAQCDFIDAALRAKTNCPISRLLHANISMSAKLKRRRTVLQVARTVVSAGLDLSVRSKEQPKRIHLESDGNQIKMSSRKEIV
jgi:lipoyl-dependent peroxiredoxin